MIAHNKIFGRNLLFYYYFVVNLALSRNVETRHPVRVIRGYKCPSEFAPEYGYRYDGTYLQNNIDIVFCKS